MSYINEALKKAQKEKDARYLNYGRLLEVGGRSRKVFSGKIILWASLGIFLIFLAFTLYSWLDFNGKNTVIVQEPKKPVKSVKPKVVKSRQDLYEKAKDLHKLGRLKESKKLYQETLMFDPGHVDTLNNLGVIYIFEGEYQKARDNLEDAIRLKPGYADPYYNLACLYSLKGETATIT